MNFPGGLKIRQGRQNHAEAFNWFLILSAELALFLGSLRELQKSVLPQYSRKHSGKTVVLLCLKPSKC